MIGRGGVFAALRAKMLAAIPPGSGTSFNSTSTIADWIQDGAFLVTECGANKIKLHVSPVDYAGATLSEVENLLNHCLEHIEEIACKFYDHRLRSEAWATVTAYYLGFFATSAILRLTGQAIVFLTRDDLRRLQTMSAATSRPGQGAFEFRIGKEVSATYTELEIVKTVKIHEATWKSVFRMLNALKNDPDVPKAADEADFYDSLCTQLFVSSGIGYDWPSSVRNLTNYKPGFMYRLARPEFRVNQFLESWRYVANDDVFEAMRGVFLRCSAGKNTFSRHAEMMISVSFILYLIARELYRELDERRLTDRRWEQQRKAYVRKSAFVEDEFAALWA